MAVTGAEKYGRYYWCIKTPASEDGEVYAFADRIEVTPNGDLMLWTGRDELSYQSMSFAKGNWSAFFAASVIDGRTISAEFWKGELDR